MALPGLYMPPGLLGKAIIPAVLSFISPAISDTDNSTTYTETSVPLGAAAADRHIIVALSWVGNGSTQRTISSATIGGVAATVHCQITTANGSDPPGVGIISALVPSGITGTISVTLSGSGGSMNFSVYRVTGLTSATPNDTKTVVGTSGVCSTTINVLNGGLIVAAVINTAEATGFTFVGVNEDVDAAESDGSPERYGSGSISGLSAQSGRTISATGGSSGVSVMAVAAWQ